VLSKLFTFIFLSSAFLALVDTFRNPHTVEKLLSISSGSILFAFFSFLLISRLFGKVLLSPIVSKLALFSGGAMLVGSSILASINYDHGANFVYSKTYLNMAQLFILGVFLASCGFISQPAKFFKKYHKKAMLCIGICTLIVFYFYNLLPFEAGYLIGKEDNLIENLQFIALVIGSIFSGFAGLKLFKQQKFLGISFLVLSLCLLFIAGDEIAWGQRILHISTPELIAASNSQGELTVHNQRSIQGYVPFAYLLLGLYGSAAWLFAKLKKFEQKIVSLIIPGTYLMPYFAMVLIYNVLTLREHTIGSWGELSELMLYSAITLHLLVLTKKSGKYGTYR